MKIAQNSILCLFLCMSMAACKNKTATGVKENDEKLITVHRFDKLLFEVPPQELQAHLQKNEKEFHVFFDAPLTDTAYINQIKLYVTDPIAKEIYDTVIHKYPNLDWLAKELTNAFANAKQYLPNEPIPEVYTLIGDGFDYGTRVIGTKEYLAIALQMYAAASFEKYGYFGLPLYLVQVLDKNYIASDCMDTWIQQIFPAQAPAETFLGKMIEKGKILYFKDLTLPSCPNHIKIRYTPEQMKWCEDNEGFVWSFFIQQNLLFEKDYLKIRAFLNEGPKTSGFPNSPGRLGDYIGWQIVKHYAEKTKLSYIEIMQQTDAQKILKESGYKPKQK